MLLRIGGLEGQTDLLLRLPKDDTQIQQRKGPVSKKVSYGRVPKINKSTGRLPECRGGSLRPLAKSIAQEWRAKEDFCRLRNSICYRLSPSLSPFSLASSSYCILQEKKELESPREDTNCQPCTFLAYEYDALRPQDFLSSNFLSFSPPVENINKHVQCPGGI